MEIGAGEQQEDIIVIKIEKMSLGRKTYIAVVYDSREEEMDTEGK